MYVLQTPHQGGLAIDMPSVGITVFWDARTMLNIQIKPESPLREQTCGLCGNSDTDATNDDVDFSYTGGAYWQVLSDDSVPVDEQYFCPVSLLLLFLKLF